MSTRTETLSPARSGAELPVLAALLARPGVRRALAALGRDGHEARIVGGAVRDALMGRAVADVDIAVTLPPDAVMALARQEGWKAIPTGIEHGTVTLILDGERIEATTLRRDVETDGRRATVAYTHDFAEDALRRDFTMNALSLSADGRIHDYATGIADAEAGLVRFMGDPETRIREDYLRILRFFRFNASHGRGAPDAAGLAACAGLKAGMSKLSRERLRQETLKLLAASRAVEAAQAMEEIGLWPMVLPGLACDVARLRQLVAAEKATGRPSDAVLRLAALCTGDGAAIQGALALSNAERQRIDAARAAASALGGAPLGRCSAAPSSRMALPPSTMACFCWLRRDWTRPRLMPWPAAPQRLRARSRPILSAAPMRRRSASRPVPAWAGSCAPPRKPGSRPVCPRAKTVAMPCSGRRSPPAIDSRQARPHGEDAFPRPMEDVR